MMGLHTDMPRQDRQKTSSPPSTLKPVIIRPDGVKGAQKSDSCHSGCGSSLWNLWLEKSVLQGALDPQDQLSTMQTDAVRFVL